jgi:hypothetical protein
VTHPFHPLRGREYEWVDRRVSWGERRLYYYDSKRRLTYIPEVWTSLAAPEPLDVFAAGAVLFRVEDLLRLVTLVESFADGEHEAERQGDFAETVKRNSP